MGYPVQLSLAMQEDQKFLVLYGRAGTGKSTVLNIVNSVPGVRDELRGESPGQQ